MKNIILLFSLLFIFSCRNESSPEPEPTPIEKITLNSPIVINENTIQLNWTTTGLKNYQSFQILKRTSEKGNATYLNQVDGKTFIKIDDEVEYIPYVDYQILGYTTTGEQILSNLVTYKRPEIKLLGIKPVDAIMDSELGNIYIFDLNGGIHLYNIAQNKITLSISSNAKLGFADLGTYNGKKELYVPRNDGWVYVYDANNLNLIDQISFKSEIESVVYHNNVLYGATKDISNKSIKTVSRSTKQIISESGFYQSGRLKRLNNTQVKFFWISSGISPTDLGLFNFDANGNLIDKMSDSYHGDYPLNHRIFESFPDGKRMITSNTGTIYDDKLKVVSGLPKGNSELTSFSFDSNYIIAGTMSKTIDFYDINSYLRIKSINTIRYPFRVFSYGNKIISLSSTNSFYAGDYYNDNTPKDLIIEIFDK